MKIIKLLILSICLPLAVVAANPEDIIDSFFSRFPTGEIKAATDDIFQTNPWMAKKEDQKTLFTNKLINLTELIGEYHGSGIVAKKQMGENLVGYSYIAKYDRQPVRFIFIFYKPQDTWTIYDISFDDEAEDGLKEALKASFTN